jgi:hypothetical protein
LGARALILSLFQVVRGKGSGREGEREAREEGERERQGKRGGGAEGSQNKILSRASAPLISGAFFASSSACWIACSTAYPSDAATSGIGTPITAPAGMLTCPVRVRG